MMTSISSHAISSNLAAFFEQAIPKINDSNILAISQKLKEATTCEYKEYPAKTHFRDIQFDAAFSEENKFVETVCAFVFADTSNTTQSNLKEKLTSKITETAQTALRGDMTFEDMVILVNALTPACPDKNLTGILNSITKSLSMKIEKSSVDIESCVWALFAFKKASKRFYRDYLFQSCCKIIKSCSHRLSAFHISLIAVSFGNANFFDPDLAISMRKRSISVQNQHEKAFTINEIINTLWGFTYYHETYISKDPKIQKMRLENIELFKMFKPRILTGKDSLNKNQQSRLTMICKYLNITNPLFFNFHLTADTLKDATALEITTITKNLCTIKENNEQLATCLAFIIQKNEADSSFFDGNLLVSITYSVLNKFCADKENETYKHFIKFALREIVNRQKDLPDYSPLNLKTICTICSHLIDSDLQKELDPILSKVEPSKQVHTSSRSHKNISHLLRQLLKENQVPILQEKDLQEEYVFEDNFSLDIAFPSHQLAIEVDGNYHYDELGRPIAKEIIKETLLQIRGWKLMRIDLKNWPRKEADQHTYLQTHLLRIGL